MSDEFTLSIRWRTNGLQTRNSFLTRRNSFTIPAASTGESTVAEYWQGVCVHPFVERQRLVAKTRETYGALPESQKGGHEMSYRKNQIPSLVVLALLCCLVIGCLDQTEPGATAVVSDAKVAGMHDPNVPDPVMEPRFIDDVRVGFEVDSDGKVPDGLESDSFAAADSIHLSVDVSDAPTGSRVQVVVYPDGSNEAVWIDEDEVPANAAHLSFVFEASTLTGGSYRTSVTIDDEVVVEKRFEIVEQTS